MNDIFNNPLGMMLNAIRQGGSPKTLLQQMAQQDPRAQQVLQIRFFAQLCRSAVNLHTASYNQCLCSTAGADSGR